MRVWFLAFAVATCSLAWCISASAQATIEGALAHSLSTSVGNGLGSAMGRATGQLAGKLGQQTSNTVQRPNTAAATRNASKVGRAPAADTSASQPNAGGGMIVSIEGSASPQVGCSDAVSINPNKPDQAKATDPTTNEEIAPANSNTQQRPCIDRVQAADAHPAVVNLPAAK